jgi:hypothetical protein
MRPRKEGVPVGGTRLEVGNGFLALWEQRDRIDRSGKEEV